MIAVDAQPPIGIKMTMNGQGGRLLFARSTARGKRVYPLSHDKLRFTRGDMINLELKV